MARHQLIIGLGGVGGRSIAAFKRTVAIHKQDYNTITEELGGRFEYLYIDSDNDILNSDIWNTYGESVRLAPSDFVMLKEGIRMDSIRKISLQENITPWIGNLAEHFATRTGKSNNLDNENLDSELIGLDGAGQLRRYGRVLFALHSQTIRHSLRDKIKNLTYDSDSEIDVRIFCTLGGGTGSGSIIDMVTLIQSLADDIGHGYRTFIYTFVAGMAQDAQDTGSFYQNEYAALRDLNALMVGKYHPYIAGVVGRDIGDNYYYGKGNHPIHAIYISSEESQGNPNLRDQVEFMANACFDTIVYSLLYKEPNCMKAFSGEDIVQINPGEPASLPLRSYRFAALGSRRWCLPIDLIQELLKMKYELRVLNSWTRGAPLPRGVQKRNISQNSLDFSPNTTKTWEAIERYCNRTKERLVHAKKMIEGDGKTNPNSLRTLNEVSTEITKNISEKLLNSTDMRLELQRYAQEDAEKLLSLLTEKMGSLVRWGEGSANTWGIDDVRSFLGNYLRGISSWMDELTEAMTKQDIEDAQKRLSETMELREKEWKKFGILHRPRKKNRMLNYQLDDCIYRIDLTLLPFRRLALSLLIEEAQNKVSSLLSHVDAASREIKICCSRLEGAIQALEHRIMTANDSDRSDQFELDKENLVKVQQEIESLDDEHAMQMARVYCPAWDKVMCSLDKCEEGAITELINSLEDAFYRSSKRLLDHVIARNNSLKGIPLSSFYEHLIQIAGKVPGPDNQNWEKKLGKKIDSFVGELRCSTFVQGNGLTVPLNAPCRAVVFGLPKQTDVPAGFVEWLKTRLVRAIPGNFRPLPGRIDFYEHSNSEIRVLYTSYWFPARFAPVVSGIFERYKDVSRHPDGNVKIYFANIDDDDIGLQSETRPPLTEDGYPDKVNARNVDLASKLYFKQGDLRAPLVKVNDSGIIIIKRINTHGIAEYSKDYSLDERLYPSDTFTTELNSAINIAIRQMDEEERQAIFDAYTKELEDLIEAGVDPDRDDAVIEAREARKSVRKRLGLND